MDHSWLGTRGRRSLLVVPSGAASSPPPCGNCSAGDCVCAARASPRSPQLSRPFRNADHQLVPLYLWHRDHLSLCCRATSSAAAKSCPRPQRAAAALLARHDSRVSVVKHRDCRLLQPAERSGAHIPIFRQLRARHELQHRLGAVRVAAPDYWDPSNGQAGAICESGITRRYRPQAFPARSFATGSALSNRCIRRRRNHRNPRIFSLSTLSRPFCKTDPMKFGSPVHRSSKLTGGLLVATFLFAGSLGALTPNEWRFSQAIDVPANGLIRVNLPAETLDAARPDLGDVRILDSAGREVPFLIDRPMPRGESALRSQELRTALEPAATQITLTTGTKASLKGVTFETPPDIEFIKAVRVESSHDGAQWRQLASDKLIFKMAGGAANPSVSFPEGIWEFLRLTIDDSRTAAVPFTGVLLQVAETNAPVEPLPVTIKTRDESLGVTRLAIDLGATNLTVASLRIKTSDPLFARQVTIAVPELANDGLCEQTLYTGSVYRVDVSGKVESRLEI